MLKQDIQIPDKCPVCFHPLSRFSVDLMCDNLTCSAKTIGIFTNMFDTLKMKGLSDKFVEKVIEMYDVHTIDGIMNLSVADFENLPGFADKSAQKAYDTLHSVKEVSPEQFMALLNIPNQGVRVFENLFSQFPIEKLLDDDFKPEDLLNTKGIAEKTANAIHAGIQANLERLRENAKWFTIVKPKATDSNHNYKLTGKSFCITGSLIHGTRNDYESKIKSAGGSVASVNKKLNFLVTNDNDTTSSKMKKVIEINADYQKSGSTTRILVINENDLIKMMED